MLIHFGTEQLQPDWLGSVVCVGTFDGVHLGHRELIKRTVERAKAEECASVVLTFDRHPASVLAPDRVPPSLLNLGMNLRAMGDLGVTCAVVLPFDKDLVERSAQEFFNAIFCEKLKAKQVVVGHDFAFGKGREGNGDWLGQRIETEIVPPFLVNGERVSSTAIRTLVANGDVEMAQTFLGRRFSIEGVVVGGKKLGRQLGFPTLNLARSGNQVLPKDGVYAASARTPFGEFLAAVSIGFRPSVGGESRTVEAYLLDYPSENLYGATVELEFTARVRDEAKYDSLEELKSAILDDVGRVRELLR